MVGSDRPNQSHHHEGRQIRDANIQSGVTFTGGAEFESTAIQLRAAAAFPAGNAGAAATIPEARANTVTPAILSATDKTESSPAQPSPSARGDSAKSNSNPNSNRAGTAGPTPGR